jgi:hypothetical protein
LILKSEGSAKYIEKALKTIRILQRKNALLTDEVETMIEANCRVIKR